LLDKGEILCIHHNTSFFQPWCVASPVSGPQTSLCSLTAAQRHLCRCIELPAHTLTEGLKHVAQSEVAPRYHVDEGKKASSMIWQPRPWFHLLSHGRKTASAVHTFSSTRPQEWPLRQKWTPQNARIRAV
jgi:hypothetical protein